MLNHANSVVSNHVLEWCPDPGGVAAQVGSLAVHVSTFREGTCSTKLFASHQCSEHALLLSLKDRGPAEVDLVTSDNQGGLTKAIRKHCCGVSRQHCHSHFPKNTLDRTPKKLQPAIKVTLSRLYRGPDLNEAVPRKNHLLERHQGEAGRAMQVDRNKLYHVDQFTA